MPLVSVIVPNFNHEHFLAERLDSIVNQSLQDIEIIFLDDCSIDNSLKVFERYVSDPRIQFCFNEENSGSPFKQWNKGLRKATGKYVWIAETDDSAELDLLDTLVSVLEENPDAGLAYCQSWIVNTKDGKTTKVLVEHWYDDFEDKVRWNNGYKNFGPKEVKDYLLFKNTIPNASAVVFRRSVLSDGLKAPENMQLAGDWMFWIEILFRSNVVYVSRALNFFREQHCGSQRKKTLKQGLELIEGLEIYSQVSEHLNIPLSVKTEARRYRVKLWGVLAYDRSFSLQTNKQIYNKFLSVFPEVRHSRFRHIIIPFTYFTIATPLKRIPVLRIPVRALKESGRKVSRLIWR